MKIEFKEFNIKDLNAITDIVNTLSFDNGEYSPINEDFFSKAYVYFLISNIVDEYMSKDENNTIIINDLSGLFKFIYSKEVLDIYYDDYNDESEKFIDMAERCFKMIDKKIEYTKQMNISRKYPLADASLSDLLDTITRVVESFENSITSDDVKKLIESKDDIISALTDKTRLDERLEEHEQRHNEREAERKAIEKIIAKRSDKFE